MRVALSDSGLGASSSTNLSSNIRETPDFVLILSAGALDRCSERGIWLRREIGYALANHKAVTPVLMPGFAFPAEQGLPEELRTIHVHAA